MTVVTPRLNVRPFKVVKFDAVVAPVKTQVVVTEQASVTVGFHESSA